MGTVPTKPAGRAAVLDTLLPGAGHMKGACEVPVPGRWIYDLFLSFSPTAEALGSSAIVKVSEQTGAAPKPIPPRFPSKGSQVKVHK